MIMNTYTFIYIMHTIHDIHMYDDNYITYTPEKDKHDSKHMHIHANEHIMYSLFTLSLFA